MTKATHIKVAGVWKKVVRAWEKVAGVWQSDIMVYHKVGGIWKECIEVIKIICSQTGIAIGWEWNDKDYFDLNVTPDSMDWTATLNDTGDGTSWVSINPASGTGDETNMYANADAVNKTGAPKSCTVTFSDDAGEALDLTLTITQQANPT